MDGATSTNSDYRSTQDRIDATLSYASVEPLDTFVGAGASVLTAMDVELSGSPHAGTRCAGM